MNFYVNGEKVRYNPYNMKKDKKLGSGCEVDAYQIDDKAVKFFKRYPGKQILLTKESIERMKDIHTKRILLPTDALLDKRCELRGYQMDYVEDLGQDSYFNLDKEKLKEEHAILREDIELLSDNKVLIEDLITENTVYHNGLYLIDPGSYQFENLDSNCVYGINIERINTYLIYEVLKGYHFVKHNNLKKFVVSYQFSSKINDEYNRSGKYDVIEFLSDIEEGNLSEFVERRVK